MILVDLLTAAKELEEAAVRYAEAAGGSGASIKPQAGPEQADIYAAAVAFARAQARSAPSDPCPACGRQP